MNTFICSHCGKIIDVANQSEEELQYSEQAIKLLDFFKATLCESCYNKLLEIIEP